MLFITNRQPAAYGQFFVFTVNALFKKLIIVFFTGTSNVGCRRLIEQTTSSERFEFTSVIITRSERKDFCRIQNQYLELAMSFI